MKFEGEGQEFSKKLRSLDQFIRILKGEKKLKTNAFLTYSWRFLRSKFDWNKKSNCDLEHSGIVCIYIVCPFLNMTSILLVPTNFKSVLTGLLRQGVVCSSHAISHHWKIESKLWRHDADDLDILNSTAIYILHTAIHIGFVPTIK